MTAAARPGPAATFIPARKMGCLILKSLVRGVEIVAMIAAEGSRSRRRLLGWTEPGTISPIKWGRGGQIVHPDARPEQGPWLTRDKDYSTDSLKAEIPRRIPRIYVHDISIVGMPLGYPFERQ